MNPTVLLVDDNQELLDTLYDGLTLSGAGLEVLTALSVDAATAILDKRTVDLVVTDVQMPGKTGFDLLAHLIQHHPGVPSIVMTGFGTPDMERTAQGLGSLRFLSKPLEIADLRREVESVLASPAAGALLDVISQAGFFQLLALERSTCLVTLTTDEAIGELAFVEGALCEAKVGTLTGRDAVFEVLSWKTLTGRDAVFEVLSWKTPKLSLGALQAKPAPSEDLHLQTLLLEAATRQDEQARDDLHP
ncbi:MAG: response regulator [Planctomycetota bacterium]